MSGEAHKTTLKDRIKNALAAFKGEPLKSITYGIEVKRCKDCTREMPQLGHWAEIRSGRWACSSCGIETEIPSLYCPWCGQKQALVRGMTKEGEA